MTINNCPVIPVELNVKVITDFGSSTVYPKDYVYTFQGLLSRACFQVQTTSDLV